MNINIKLKLFKIIKILQKLGYVISKLKILKIKIGKKRINIGIFIKIKPKNNKK